MSAIVSIWRSLISIVNEMRLIVLFLASITVDVTFLSFVSIFVILTILSSEFFSNDARRNVIMALIFASRDTFHEVAIFFHDRLLRACRSTKVNTDKLLAFDSPNQEPLAKIGINIDENEHLFRPPPRGSLRVHTRMDTRLLTLRLIPGFDDAMMKHIVHAARQTQLKSLVLQLYGAGNLPMIKDDFIRVLADATDAGVLVVASSQCYSGSVVMGYYATGK